VNSLGNHHFDDHLGEDDDDGDDDDDAKAGEVDDAGVVKPLVSITTGTMMMVMSD
jgi:hypothetical protein